MHHYLYKNSTLIEELVAQARTAAESEGEWHVDAEVEFEPSVAGVKLGKVKLSGGWKRKLRVGTLSDQEKADLVTALCSESGICWQGRPTHGHKGKRFAQESTAATQFHVPAREWIDKKQTPSLNIWLATPKVGGSSKSLLCLLEHPITDRDGSVFFDDTSAMHSLMALLYILRKFNPRLVITERLRYISREGTEFQHGKLGTETHPHEVDEIVSASPQNSRRFLENPAEALIEWGAIPMREDEENVETLYYIRSIGTESNVVAVFGYPLWVRSA